MRTNQGPNVVIGKEDIGRIEKRFTENVKVPPVREGCIFSSPPSSVPILGWRWFPLLATWRRLKGAVPDASFVDSRKVACQSS
jgi:hypothetical protein